jgi:hypothetical protein
LKHKILYVVIFAVGLGIGAISMYALDTRNKPVGGDNDTASQVRIDSFQTRLNNATTKEDTERVSRDLEAQIQIEDLTIKGREARYSKFTLLSPLILTVITLLAGLTGAFITNLFARRGTHDVPASTKDSTT